MNEKKEVEQSKEIIFVNYKVEHTKKLTNEVRDFFLELLKESKDLVENKEAQFIIDFSLSIDLQITEATLRTTRTTFDANKPYWLQ
jgi:hypothetical protein